MYHVSAQGVDERMINVHYYCYYYASRKILSVEELETLPAGTKPRTLHHWSPGGERRGKRKPQIIFFDRTREGYCQPDKHWNRFKGNIGQTSERQGGVHSYGLFRAHRYHLELNWTELIWLKYNTLIGTSTITTIFIVSLHPHPHSSCSWWGARSPLVAN